MNHRDCKASSILPTRTRFGLGTDDAYEVPHGGHVREVVRVKLLRGRRVVGGKAGGKQKRRTNSHMTWDGELEVVSVSSSPF